MHLICGECGALLLDTGYGIGNLKSVIEQLTDKPVSVFNTHWHGDHTGGNSQFENVYMHEFDIPYWKESLSCEAGRMLPTTLAFSQDAVIPLSDKFVRAVHDGMTFHLGGRIETIVHARRHTLQNLIAQGTLAANPSDKTIHANHPFRGEKVILWGNYDFFSFCVPK